jgi:hypothetical protein
MKRRRSRSKRGSWLDQLFNKTKPSLGHDEISPALKRDSETAWEKPKHDIADELPPSRETRAPVSEKPRSGVETLPEKKRRPPWWYELFAPRKRRRKSHKKPTPLFIKPIEPEAPRSKLQMSRRLMISINSTIMYLIAFVIMYIVYQMAVIFTANNFGISGVLYYYQVFWPIGNSSPLWFPYYKIILITGSGPFVSLIFGIIFFRIFVPRLKNPIAKLFFLWVALHGLNFFFGGFVAGVTTSDGFGYVALWMRMNIVFRILFSMIALFGLAAFGYHSTRYFLETALSPSFLKSEKRIQFMTFHALIPSILGAIIIILLRMPNNPPYQVIILATMLAATITAVFNRRTRPDKVKSFPKHHGRRLQLGYLFFMVLLLFGFRYGLEYGLHFIIKFSVNISVFGTMP